MKWEQFSNEINRLKQNFGEKAFSPPKVSIMWEKLKHVDSEIFHESVENLILEKKFAPAFSEFEEQIDKSRTDRYRREKESLRADAKDFWGKTSYDDTDTAIAMDKIKRRCMGKCPDEEWVPFVKLLEERAARSQINT